MSFREVVTAFVAVSLFALAGFAQTNAKGKSYFMHGTVEQINDVAQSVRVRQEKIAGYSDARIATYNVDDASILKKLEVGDKIVATIYEKDYTLHNIQVVRIDDRFGVK
jgi:hypothetical protein